MRFIRLAPILFLTTFAVAQSQLPTMADIQTDYDAAKYQDVVRKVAGVMNLRGNAAANYDKGKLYVIRGESLLHLKQYSTAAEAFTNAAKETTDEKASGLYKSTALLIKRSPGGMYTPKQPSTQPSAAPGGKAAPISILEPKSRKQAMAALFNDELKPMLPKIDAMGKQQSVMPLMNGIKQVGDLRDLEIAATGSDAQTKKLLGEIAARAGQLMGSAVKQIAQNVQEISDRANETSQTMVSIPGGGMQAMTVRKGLISTDIATLNDAADTCRNIAAACEAMGQGAQTGPLAGVGADATRLADECEKMLKTDYATGGTNVTTPQIVQPGQQTQPGQTGQRGQQTPAQGGVRRGQ